MKYKFFFVGLPVHLLLIVAVVAYFFDRFFGSGAYIALIGFFIVLLFLAPLYKGYTYFSLSHLYLPSTFFKLGVKLPQKDIDLIKHAIDEDETIHIACLPDKILRSALRHHIESRFGQVQFVDSSTWDMATQPYDTAALELRAPTPEKLSTKVGVLLSRGWHRTGTLYHAGKNNNICCQRMAFERH